MKSTCCKIASWASAFLAVSFLASAADPVNPFEPASEKQAEPNGYVVLSDGMRIDGRIGVTAGLLLRIYDRAKKVHVDLSLEEIARIDIEVEKEWLDQSWRWREAGSPEKVYTDSFYTNHRYVCRLTLEDGATIRGDLNVVLYVDTEAGRQKLFIRKFYTGKHGPRDSVPEIVYVRHVVLSDPPVGEDP